MTFNLICSHPISFEAPSGQKVLGPPWIREPCSRFESRLAARTEVGAHSSCRRPCRMSSGPGGILVMTVAFFRKVAAVSGCGDAASSG